MSKYFRDKDYDSSVRKYTKNGHKPLSDIGVLRELRKLEKELSDTEDFLNAVEESINSMCDLGFSVKDFKKSWIKTRYNKNDKTKK